jgi:hypothetical protein
MGFGKSPDYDPVDRHDGAPKIEEREFYTVRRKLMSNA